MWEEKTKPNAWKNFLRHTGKKPVFAEARRKEIKSGSKIQFESMQLTFLCECECCKIRKQLASAMD